MADWALGTGITGLSYSSEYEAREAARFAGYTYIQFYNLPVLEKIYIVAHFRTYHHIENALARKQEAQTH